MAHRLRAHARLCRHIAVATWNEEAAVTLTKLAEDCLLAAERLAPAARPVPEGRQRAPGPLTRATSVSSAT